MMKKISIVISLLIYFAFSANAQHSVAESISLKISQRMKDSLGLSDFQKNQLHTINMQMDSSRQVIWRTYQSPDTLRSFLQQVENKRDSLYHPVFTEQQFQLYLLKKRNLISNN